MDNFIKDLDALRAGVKSWASHAEALIAGAPLTKEQSPVLPTECDFGRWYYNEGRALNGFSAYKRLEIPHDNQHILYLRIFNLLVEDPDVSTLDKILGKGKGLKEERREEAITLLPHLQGVNKQILELIDLLEDQVKAGYKDTKTRLKELSTEDKSESKFSEVNKMLESLEIKINQDLD